MNVARKFVSLALGVGGRKGNTPLPLPIYTKKIFKKIIVKIKLLTQGCTSHSKPYQKNKKILNQLITQAQFFTFLPIHTFLN